MSVGDEFFDETREQSVVKATIVEKYFDIWAGIMTATQDRDARGDNKIGYVDLFAGPGRYKTDAISTPLRVLQKAVSNPVYAQRLLTIFNDKSPENASSLRQAIQELDGIGTLKYPPTIWNEEVGDKIAARFESINTIPILAFIDPWGYKGLTLRLVEAFLKNWGCDCIFFFNYERINAGINNHMVEEHMIALFGKERADALRLEMADMMPAEREATIVERLTEALSAIGGKYVLPFCFKNEKGTRTKHHLILVTKHCKGYEVMKEIMARSSTATEQGVPTFTYCPSDSSKQPMLFELNRPLDELSRMLLRDFSGKRRTMVDVYKEHCVGRRYIKKNYKDTLAELEKAKLVATDGRKSTRGFADNIIVTFPARRT